MANNISRLQFRHYNDVENKLYVFETREKALTYLSDITDETLGESYRLDETLAGEPIVIKYKDENGKEQLILAIGTDGERGVGVFAPFHVIDSANLEAGIEALEDVTDELRQQILDLAAGLSAETAERKAADEVLQGEIDDLNDRLDEEIARAEDAEADLQDQIDYLTIKKYDGLLETNVKEAYILVDRDGDQHGEQIKIYKDSSLITAYLGHMDDTADVHTGEITKTDTGSEALCLLYQLADGLYELVNINLESFIEENEFKDGLVVNEYHEVKVKIDENSETFLTVSPDGVKLSGVQDAIDSAADGLQAELDRTQAGAGLDENGDYIHYHDGHYIDDSEINSLYAALIKLDTSLYEENQRAEAKENELHEEVVAETERAEAAEQELDGKITEERERAEAKEAELHEEIVAETERAETAEQGLQDAIDAEADRATQKEAELEEAISGSSAEIDRIEAGAGLDSNGNYIQHNTQAEGMAYISEATSIDNATVLLDRALKAEHDSTVAEFEAVNERIGTVEENLAAEVERSTEKDEELEAAVNALTIEKITTGLEANIREAYKLVGIAGTQLGARIDIYKDSSLIEAYLGHTDDRLVDPTSPEHVDGTGDAALCFVYQRADGLYNLVAINVEAFLEESEFKDGLIVNNHEVRVKIDETSEDFLTVGENGVKLSGVQDAIDSAASDLIDALDQEIARATAKEDELDAKIDEETARAESGEDDLSDRIDKLEVKKYEGTLEPNVKEAYVLVNREGDQQGEIIPIYKDSSLVNVYLGHMDDTIDEHTGVVTTAETGSEALCMVYTLSDGLYKLIKIDLESFIQENEFKDGLVVNEYHEVKVKIDETSEVFLTVGPDGLKLSGVQDAIDSASDDLQAELDRTQAGAGLDENGDYIHYHDGHYISPMEIDSLYKAIIALDNALYGESTSTQSAIDNLASGLSAEIARAMAKEDELDTKIDDEITRATEAEEALAQRVEALETGLADEIDRATAKEDELETAINDEVGRATAKEDELEQAINSLSGSVESAISALDYSDTADSKKVVTSVSEADGIISVVRDFVGADMVKVNQVTPSGANVKEEFELVNGNGERLGSTIKVYKDSSLENVYLGHVDDTLPDPTSPSHTTGTGDTALCFIYLKADGTYSLVPVNVEDFLQESEFKNGLQVVNHEVSVRIDAASEPFLTVSETGVKLSGVQDAINAASAGSSTEVVKGTDAGNNLVITSETAADGHKVYTVGLQDVASLTALNTLSASVESVEDAVEDLERDVTALTEGLSDLADELAAEVSRATGAENALNTRVDTISGNVNTLSGAIATEALTRENADTLLGTRIENEATTRATAVSNEAAIRELVDNTISGLVATEKSQRETAVSGLQDAIDAEEQAREDADDELDERIAGLGIEEVTTGLDSNVLKAYELKNKDGQTQGARINIYKDSSLYLAYLGHVDDQIPADGSSPTVTPGVGDTALCLIYINNDGKYQLVTVDVNQFLEETEFEDGLDVNNHVVKVKIDNSGEPYLTVGPNGVKIDGINDAIGAAKSAATVEVVEGTDPGNNMEIVQTYGANGNPLYTVNLADIASDSEFQAVSAKTAMMLGSEDELLQTSVIHAIRDATESLIVPGGVVYELTTRVTRLEDNLSALTATVAAISNRIDAILAGLHGVAQEIVVDKSDETNIGIGFADDAEFDAN